MKQLMIIITISFLFPQNVRYLDEVFENVQKTEDIVYGNAPDLPFIFLFEWNTVDIDLDMDIYEPEGDTLTNRPVIVFVHTGSFFSGHNELDDVVDLATSAAKRGYVAVSINYRLGLNALSTYSAERALYRAVQDGGAAIRYLREYSEEFGINPNNIFMWGTSAGAFVAIHLSYLDFDDRPESTYGGGLDPDLGCPVCEVNEYVQDPRPNAIVSCWGAIGDLDWIDSTDTVPAIMFHGTADPVVPFNSGLPFTLNIFFPIVYGSNLMGDKFTESGINHELYFEEGLLHEYWGTVNGNWLGGPNEYFYQIQSDAYSFLYNYLDSESLIISGLEVSGGLNEVYLQWEPNNYAESYNIYRDDEFIGNISSSNSNYLDDGTFGDETGWGLGYDVEYCYYIRIVEADGTEGEMYDEACATTLPQLQAIFDLDVSLANSDVAAVSSPFGDLTGDGNVDAVIMIKMVNFLAINGYQFNFSMDPDIVTGIETVDGTYIQYEICLEEAIEMGMDESFAILMCEGSGFSSGLEAQMSSPGSSGVIMGFDITGQGFIPPGYPGDGGDEGNLLALLILDPQYSGPGSEVDITISNFVVSGINPFTDESVSLNACDADLDPWNGCFDLDTFSTPIEDCMGIPGGSAEEDECGICDGPGAPCFPDGDVNQDGETNILDIIATVNIIIGVDDFNELADINQDGIVNILDVVSLIEIVLG